MKKIVSVILVIATILSIASGIFLYKPKQAKALVFDLNALKEFVLDTLPKTVARYAMVRLQQEIARWAKGGFTDENAPFTMTSWKEEIKNALDLASAEFIEEFNLTKFCSPLNYTLGEMFGIGIPYGGKVPYYKYAACTMDTIVDNVEAFWKNPSLAIYGWDAWSALSQPQNNIYGSFLMALSRKAEIQEAEEAEKELQKDTGSGYKNESECVAEQSMSDEELKKCKQDCSDKSVNNDGIIDADKFTSCLNKCDSGNTGICLKDVTKNLGSTIQSSMEKAVGSDMDWLITADEITEMLNLVFSSLFNKMIQGLGLNSTTSYTSSQQNFKYNSEYSYYTNFKKALTQEDVNKLRTNILDSILRSIKSITANSYTCDEGGKYQLEGNDYHNVIVEILEQESQHLYVGMEGVDIKPDYTVLDNSQAVNAGIAIYGETWDDISVLKYPKKCAEISKGWKCKEIKNNLPFEARVEDIKPGECTALPPEYAPGSVGCLQAINQNLFDGLSDDEAIKKAMTDTCDRCWPNEVGGCSNTPCCSSYTVGKQCLDGGYLVDGLKSTCNECLKNGEQQCENIANATEKENCLKIHCSNYQNIPQLNPTSIPGAVEFYKRCQLVRLRENCSVCLKEYFMPASYCQEIYDFTNRAFVKYPALVKYDSWYGRKNPSFSCDSNGTSGGQVPLGLICRILPDFGGASMTFSIPSSSGGTQQADLGRVFGTKNLCRQKCNVTDEELLNLIDNKPGDGDCSPRLWTVNATTPDSGKFIQAVHAKCCAALWWSGAEGFSYQKCRDAESQQSCTFAKPVNEEPWCYCNEGDRPLGFQRTGPGPGGGEPDPGPDIGGDCANFGFDSPNKKVYGYTNNSPGGDVVYIANDSCDEISGPEDGDAVPPSSSICSWETGGDKGKYECDLSGIFGAINAGVYHNQYPGDTSTGWHVCVPCDPKDPGYPSYGSGDLSGGTIPYNQCVGKDLNWAD